MTHMPLPGYVVPVHVKHPSLDNNTADAERLTSALASYLGTDRIYIPLSILRRLPGILRQSDHDVKVVLFRGHHALQVAGILPAKHPTPITGIAVDIGTTKVVLQLLDLETGQPMGQVDFDNPQAQVGPDVLTRIHHAGTPVGIQQLQSMIVTAMNGAILTLCMSCGLNSSDVYLVAGAGNTAMTHLFLGIDPQQIIREPYIPCVNSMDTVDAKAIGLDISESGLVFVFPNIGSYFGGDLLAGILFSGLHKQENPCILVDVGTNAEIVVGNKDWLMACAGAAGPALESGVSKMGMTAGPGVIDRVRIDPCSLEMEIHTIDDKPPVGICGSGMIDLVSQLFLSKMIDIRGKFSPEVCGPRLVEKDGIPFLVLVEQNASGTGQDIVFSQVDLNSLTSSKAAMYTILEVIVCRTAGICFEDLETFFVAGTFGSFIDPVSAISIGMLPDMDLERFKVLGNSSLGGAMLMLTDTNAYDDVRQIRQAVTYIELNVNSEFMNMFSGAKFYPHTDISRFPSLKNKM